MNKIEAAFERMKNQLADRLNNGIINQAQVDEANEASELDLSDYCDFQSVKSLAQAQGKLTLSEAQTVYSKLGETVETYNSQPLHVKAVLLQLFKELIDWRIQNRKENKTVLF